MDQELELVIKIDSKEVKKATKRLNKLAEAAERAAKATTELAYAQDYLYGDD